MLGQAHGIVAVGELRYLWARGPVEDVLCTCGERFSKCSFWTAVGERAFGGWDRLPAAEVLALQQRVDRHRRLPEVFWGRVRGRRSRPVAAYITYLERLYEAILAVSGASVVVDSTKDPPHAWLLWRSNRIDLRIVHLIRDSRAVAYAWTKRMRRPEVQEREVFMDRERPHVIGWKWNDYNLLFGLLRRAQIPSVSIRYEDLAGDPAAALERALSLVADAAADGRSVQLEGGVFVRGEGHALSGNPGRFQVGPVEIRRDDDWRAALPRRQFWIVTAITLPLLMRYRYPLRPQGRT